MINNRMSRVKLFFGKSSLKIVDNLCTTMVKFIQFY